jgi:two-component system phosphate regulon response regulator PhoB
VSQEKPRVLVVEDDVSILTGVSMNLRFEGYEVLQAQDGARGLEMAVSEAPDLIVLDVMMPRLNGYEVLRELRSRGVRTPVLVLSAKGMERDKVLGLDLGADDYVVKPFSVRELLLRVKAVLRRSDVEEGPEAQLSVGDIQLDTTRHQVRAKGQEVVLTALEFRLLHTLMERADRVQTREVLLSDVWGIQAEIHTRTVDTHIKRLREKLGPAGDIIETVRGVGYKLSPP